MRNVRPELFEDEELIKVELKNGFQPNPRFILIGIWMLSDREGRFEWNLFKLHRKLCAESPLELFQKIMDILQQGNWLCRYREDGSPDPQGLYGHVRTFLRYQVAGRKERPSVLPQCQCCGNDKTPTGEVVYKNSAGKPTKAVVVAEPISVSPECTLCQGYGTVLLRMEGRPVTEPVSCPVCLAAEYSEEARQQVLQACDAQGVGQKS